MSQSAAQPPPIPDWGQAQHSVASSRPLSSLLKGIGIVGLVITGLQLLEWVTAASQRWNGLIPSLRMMPLREWFRVYPYLSPGLHLILVAILAIIACVGFIGLMMRRPRGRVILLIWAYASIVLLMWNGYLRFHHEIEFMPSAWLLSEVASGIAEIADAVVLPLLIIMMFQIRFVRFAFRN